jgi:hypothetical protein
MMNKRLNENGYRGRTDDRKGKRQDQFGGIPVGFDLDVDQLQFCFDPIETLEHMRLEFFLGHEFSHAAS